MDIRGISERCKEIIFAPIDDLSFNTDDVCLSELYQDNWIRVLIIRDRIKSDIFTLEIEFSTPSADSVDVDPKVLLSQAIAYLEYMQSLEKIGFTLELVDEDWLWSAHKVFTEIPSDELFERLRPPST